MRYAAIYQRARTAAEAEEIRKENFGFRFSILLLLVPYGFDPIRMDGIDTLHALCIGVCVRVCVCVCVCVCVFD